MYKVAKNSCNPRVPVFSPIVQRTVNSVVRPEGSVVKQEVKEGLWTGQTSKKVSCDWGLVVGHGGGGVAGHMPPRI